MQALTWDSVRDEFTFDGSWRDIYVLCTDMTGWQRTLDGHRAALYEMTYFRDEQPAGIDVLKRLGNSEHRDRGHAAHTPCGMDTQKVLEKVPLRIPEDDQVRLRCLRKCRNALGYTSRSHMDIHRHIKLNDDACGRFAQPGKR